MPKEIVPQRIHGFYQERLCKGCLNKVETNEIKIRYTGVRNHGIGNFALDHTKDNSCDKCHKQFHYTELNRVCYLGEGGDEYLCNQCVENERQDPNSLVSRL